MGEKYEIKMKMNRRQYFFFLYLIYFIWQKSSENKKFEAEFLKFILYKK